MHIYIDYPDEAADGQIIRLVRGEEQARARPVARDEGPTADTETPPGGVIVRKPGSQEPAGLLMETAFLPIFSALPKPSPEQSMAALEQGQLIYAAAGITTAQEGATHMADLAILQRGADEGKLFIDVVAYPFITEFEEVLSILVEGNNEKCPPNESGFLRTTSATAAKI